VALVDSRTARWVDRLRSHRSLQFTLWIVGVVAGAVVLGRWVATGPLAAAAANITTGHILRLVFSGVAGVLVLVLAMLFVRGRSAELAVVSILCLGFPFFLLVGPLLVLYRDSFGFGSSITVSGVVLLLAFVASVSSRGHSVLTRVAREPVVWCMGIIALAGVLTQSVHLGIVPAVGVVYDRVLQPLMLIVVVARLVQRSGSVRPAATAFVAAAFVGVASRMALSASGTGAALLPDVRAAAIGSWTIYGTILAATCMLLLGLGASARPRWPGLLWLAGLPVAVSELLATGTRGAIAGLAAVGAFVLARSVKLRIAVVGLGIVGMLIFSATYLPVGGGRVFTLDPAVLSTDVNWVFRVERNGRAADFILANPVSGLGLGNPSDPRYADISVYVDNPYLAWGVAFGLPALLAFAGLMVVTLRDAYLGVTRSTERERYLRIGLLAALLAWVINQFGTGDSLTYLQSMESVLFFYGVVGMVLGAKWVDAARGSALPPAGTGELASPAKA